MNGELSVLLVDEGDLGAAREVLTSLDVRLDQVRGELSADDLEQPYDLIVSSVRQVPALSQALAGSTGEAVKTPWVGIHSQDFLPIRDRLRRAGVDYLVVEGVDAEVLRLLFLHALYGGPERRDQPRMPVGADIVYEVRHNEGSARLMDLTPNGCRVVGAAPVGAGMQIRLRFQSGLSAGREVTVQGRIVRVERTPSGEPAAAIRFLDLDERANAAIRSILEGQALGTRVTPLGVTPVALPPAPRSATAPVDETAPAAGAPEPTPPPAAPQPPPAPISAAPEPEPQQELEPIRPLPTEAQRTAAPPAKERASAPAPPAEGPKLALRAKQAGAPGRAPAPPVAAPPEPAPADSAPELVLDQVDRRHSDRASYERPVTAEHGRRNLVLVGRDLSTQGMRVAPEPDIRVGMQLRLTIYGGPRQRPVVVPAEVAQDDGVQGFLLRFLPLKRPELERIDQMVREAPAVQALGGTSELRPVYLSETQTSIFTEED